jgi:hypothetical protein
VSTPRSTHDEALAAGLVSLRAQGLEPSDYAKDLARKVAAGEITPQAMEDALLDRYRKREVVATKSR